MLDKNNIPKHIAIIMDGNRRWARKRALPRSAGHRAGIKRIREVVKAASELGIKAITIFAFSTENWQRPKKEVGMLMKAFSDFLVNEVDDLNKNDIRLRIAGSRNSLSRELLEKIEHAQDSTATNNGLTLVLAFNYGGRAEIVDASREFAQLVSEKKYKANQLDEKLFSKFLYQPDLPEPDLLIRTSGELRISNFLIWGLAYAELYFTEKYWPDFTKEDLVKAIIEYQKRQRRFGRI